MRGGECTVCVAISKVIRRNSSGKGEAIVTAATYGLCPGSSNPSLSLVWLGDRRVAAICYVPPLCLVLWAAMYPSRLSGSFSQDAFSLGG